MNKVISNIPGLLKDILGYDLKHATKSELKNIDIYEALEIQEKIDEVLVSELKRVPKNEDTCCPIAYQRWSLNYTINDKEYWKLSTMYDKILLPMETIKSECSLKDKCGQGDAFEAKKTRKFIKWASDNRILLENGTLFPFSQNVKYENRKMFLLFKEFKNLKFTKIKASKVAPVKEEIDNDLYENNDTVSGSFFHGTIKSSFQRNGNRLRL